MRRLQSPDVPDSRGKFEASAVPPYGSVVFAESEP